MTLIGMPEIPEPDRARNPRGEIRSMVKFAAQYFEVPITDITGKGRDWPLVRCKHMIRGLARVRWPELSLNMIAEATGAADHSTIINSVKKHNDLMATDRSYVYDFNQFAAQCSIGRIAS